MRERWSGTTAFYAFPQKMCRNARDTWEIISQYLPKINVDHLFKNTFEVREIKVIIINHIFFRVLFYIYTYHLIFSKELKEAASTVTLQKKVLLRQSKHLDLTIPHFMIPCSFFPQLYSGDIILLTNQ